MKKILIHLAVALTVALAATSMTGCMDADDIRFHGISGVDMQAGVTPRVNLIFDVENRSRRDVHVHDAIFDITDPHGNSIGRLSVPENVEIPRHKRTHIAVPVDMEFINPINGMMFLLQPGSLDGLRVNGKVILKAGGFRRRIIIDDMPAGKFLHKLNMK